MSKQLKLDFARQPLVETDPNRRRKRAHADDDTGPQVLSKLSDIVDLVRSDAPKNMILNSLTTLMSEIRDEPSSNASNSPIITWAAPSPLAHVDYALVPLSVDTKSYIFNTVWSRFEALHDVAPAHSLFGSVSPGALRAPLRDRLGKGAPCSWLLRVNSFADSVVKRMGTQIVPGSCWILDRQDTSIQRKLPDGSAETIARYKHHRLLAFLRIGTPEAWEHFRNGDPGLHFCHNGVKKDRGWLCVNGVEHVLFGSAEENNKQRRCAGLDRSQCPGHGAGLDRCIYVWLEHEDPHLVGVPRPCLNSVNGSPEVCGHSKSCK